MKKFFTMLLCALLLVHLYGCNKQVQYWNFQQEYLNIVEISIVEIDPESVDYCKTSTIDLFYASDVCDRISMIPMEKYGTNLKTQHGIGIFILYQNGEYDLITANEPKHYRYNDNMKLQGYNSWLKCCDTDDFSNLISYLQKLQ